MNSKSENPWHVESLYEYQYFNCPSCSFKNPSKQDFVDHTFDIHPESVENFKKISDGSLSDITIPALNYNNDEKNIDNSNEVNKTGDDSGGTSENYISKSELKVVENVTDDLEELQDISNYINFRPREIRFSAEPSLSSPFISRNNIEILTKRLNIKSILRNIHPELNGFSRNFPSNKQENVHVLLTTTSDKFQTIGQLNVLRKIDTEKSQMKESKTKNFDLINTTRLFPASSNSDKLKKCGIEKIEVLRDRRVQLKYVDKNQTKKILRISSDGKNITDLSNDKQFHYPNLPSDYFKLYKIAAKYIKLLRSKTPKITSYDIFENEADIKVRNLIGATSKLMENCPNANFEVQFYNGVNVIFDSFKGYFVKNGDEKSKLYDLETIEISEFSIEWKMFKKLHERLKNLANFCEENGQTLPITQGKRPK